MIDRKPGIARRALHPAGAATPLVLALLLTAPPALARDEFERGFKDELGRIAAHETVRAGRQVVAALVFGPPGPARDAPRARPDHDRRERFHGRGGRVPPGHRKHHHVRGHDHRHRLSCDARARFARCCERWDYRGSTHRHHGHRHHAHAQRHR